MGTTTALETLDPQVQSLLLAEILGFSPQLLLDDIINIANNAVQDVVHTMDEYLQNWADKRAEREGGDWDSTQDVEQGIVAFQTLLEFHTDVAFDFFEAWSLRNIFAIPPGLPIVLPHHENLDMTQAPEREQELMDEIATLRKKIDSQRRLKRTLNLCLLLSKNKHRKSEKRFERLSILDSPNMNLLPALPDKLQSMHHAFSGLSALDDVTINALTQLHLTEPGKRQWETSKSGYLNWAVEQLLLKAKEQNKTGGQDGRAEAEKANQLRAAYEAMEGVRTDLQTVGGAESDEMEE